jgi:hypothetical protein
VSELVERLRKGVPCGCTLGHGERCAKGWLCEACQLRIEAADEIEKLESDLNNTYYAYDMRDMI